MLSQFWEHLKDLFLPDKVTNVQDLWWVTGFTIGTKVVEIMCEFILAKISIRIVLHMIHRFFRSRAIRADERRKLTLESLLDNVSRYTIYFIFILFALQTLGVDIRAFLAGASIAGVALGFGAQSLVKDILTGFFILFEDQYGVGDLVKINNFTGTVQSIGLRLTRLKAWTGEVEIIPNGQITQVTNYSKNNSLAVVDVAVSYQNDVEKARNVMQRVLDQVGRDLDDVVGDVQVLGVQALRDHDVLLRATAECRPTRQVGVQRTIQERLKKAFEDDNIQIPYAQPDTATVATNEVRSSTKT